MLKDYLKDGLTLECVKEHLPANAMLLVDVLGYEDATKLILSLGGSSVFFSSRGSLYFNKLAEIIGENGALKLNKYMRENERFYVPSCAAAVSELRAMVIFKEFCRLRFKEDYSANLALLEICPKFGITDRSVYKIARKIRTAHLPK